MQIERDQRFDSILLSRIEDAGLNASAPPQQRWVDGLLRFSPGRAKRARCINAVAIGRLSIADRLAACRSVFDQAGLPLIVRITPFSQPPELDALLEARGLLRIDDTWVMVFAELSGVAGAAPSALPGAALERIDTDALAQRVGLFRGLSAPACRAHADRLARAPVPFSAFQLRVDGEVVACGQVAIEGALVGLYDIFTEPTSRCRGYAGWLCRQLLAYAAAQGAQQAYLQVEGDNLAARRIYQRLGFADAYAYHYRVVDPHAD